MFKRSIFIALTVLSTLSLSAQVKYDAFSELSESETVTSMREHILNLSAAVLEGRAAGSEGEKEAAQYMSKCFDRYGITLLSEPDGDIFGLKGETDTLVSRNVVAVIPGYDRQLRDHYIVIGARLDNMGINTLNIDGQSREQVFYGANGNASGLAMLLELGRRLQMNSVLLRRSVLLVAFGASLKSNAGSWYFLNRSFSKVANIDAMINLDMLGTGSNGFYAYTSSNPDMSNIISKLAGTLQPVQPQLVAKEPCQSDHRSFYDKEIPSVFFTTGMYPEYNSTRDTESIIEYEEMDREMEYIYSYALALSDAEKPVFRQSDELKRKTRREEGIMAYNDCDVAPIFLGASDPVAFLNKWVYVYLKYPEKCIDEGIQGRVLVDFIIDEKGKVQDVRVLRGVHPLLDAEALRVVSASPDWKPAKHRGQKVSCEMSIYVEFRLKKR